MIGTSGRTPERQWEDQACHIYPKRMQLDVPKKCRTRSKIISECTYYCPEWCYLSQSTNVSKIMAEELIIGVKQQQYCQPYHLKTLTGICTNGLPNGTQNNATGHIDGAMADSHGQYIQLSTNVETLYRFLVLGNDVGHPGWCTELCIRICGT